MKCSEISVVITTFDEAEHVDRCLASVRGFGDVVVVDSFSADETVERCRPHATAIFQRTYRSPPDQKNWAVARASNDWVLVLDADEEVEPALRDEIEALLPDGVPGFWIRRRSDYLGRTIRGCGWQRDKVLRLYDRRRGGYPESRVHEEVELDGTPGRLRSFLRHRPYRDVDQHMGKIDAYTTLGARQYLERGGRAPLLRMCTHPPFRFLRMFFLQFGFRDGYPGFVLCLLSSYSVFLKYAKAWELKRRA